MYTDILESTIDHLVVTAPGLQIGCRYIRETLGLAMHPGGEHTRMATHNCLLKLGDKCYLEVIAINPDAPAPNRPRWFLLDDPSTKGKVRLTTWLARSNDILSAVAKSPLDLGEVETMSRGVLEWRITQRGDGSMPLDGIAPSLIQWSNDKHPAASLGDSGCELVSLEAYHPRSGELQAHLQEIGFRGPLRVYGLADGLQPYLLAQIRTPYGVRQLGCAAGL
jgi:hypothetical protein